MAPSGDRSMPVTRTPVSTATPSARARRASSVVEPLGSIHPSPGRYIAPWRSSGDMSGKQPERFGRRDRVHVETEGPRGPDLPPQEEPLIPARGDAKAPDLVPVLGRARGRLEAPVEPDRVRTHAHDRRGGVKVRDHSRRVPRRPAGELALVEEQDVGPALLREVVRDAAAGDAPADDHDPSLVSHTPPGAPRASRTTGPFFPRRRGPSMRERHRRQLGRRGEARSTQDARRKADDGRRTDAAGTRDA